MKRPSFQFYPGDWLRDTALRSCSVSARGLWIDMISLMHEGSPYGYLKVGGKVILPANLARMVGATIQDVEGWLMELETASVFSKDDSGCIYSRRMVRDESIRIRRACGGILGGNPALLKVNLPPNLKPTPSSSSSSSSSDNTHTINDRDQFEKFWRAYPRKVGKKKALEIFRRINGRDLSRILSAIQAQCKTIDWTKDGGRFIPHPATWLNQGRWEDDVTTYPKEKKPINYIPDAKPDAKQNGSNLNSVLPEYFRLIQ